MHGRRANPRRSSRCPRVAVRVWVSGHYETRIKKVYHAGYWIKEVIPAVYENRIVIVYDPCTGARWQETRAILVYPERIINRFIQGWWEDILYRHWVSGYWKVLYR